MNREQLIERMARAIDKAFFMDKLNQDELREGVTAALAEAGKAFEDVVGKAADEFSTAAYDAQDIGDQDGEEAALDTMEAIDRIGARIRALAYGSEVEG